jgi:hypothetical protein
MKFNRKANIIKGLLLLSILGIIAAFFTSYLFQRDSRRQSNEFESSSKSAHGKGISFVEYHGDKKVYSISIDSFSIERARLGPFAIGPLHIAHLNKVTIDLYFEGIESKLDKEKGVEWEILDFENPILNIKSSLPFQMNHSLGLSPGFQVC